jgi:cytochrome P450 family 110
MLHSIWAGLDPDGFFRSRAGRREPSSVFFPGLGPVHFFATAEAAQDILTTPGTMVEAPTPNPIAPIVGTGSLILVSGEDHRRKRRVLMPALHGQRMRAHADVMAQAALNESASWRPGLEVSLSAAARSIALRVIVLAMFGVENGDRFEEFTNVATALMHANSAALMLVPWLRREFAGRGPWARLVDLRSRFDALLTEQVAERRSDSNDKSLLRSVLAHDLESHDLYDQLRTMVVAGHDTTAGALMWALYHIHREPEIRDRVIAELDGLADPKSLPELPYLTAVVSEALRMHPAVPIVLRRLTAEVKVDGNAFSPGDVVGIGVPSVHFDPAIWPDPHRFDPDRFLNKSPTPFEYLPFGGGFRRCPGAAFATYELAISIGTLLNTVELSMPQHELRRKPPRSLPRGVAVVPSREVKLTVTRRL